MKSFNNYAKKQPPTDPTGFWKVTYTTLSYGGSALTFAYTERPNNQCVFQVYCEPKMSTGDLPSSTYRVFPGIHGLLDDFYKKVDQCRTLLLEKHPSANLEALRKGSFDVWSPDGEGELCVVFGDLEVEEALAFADSLEPYKE